MGPRTGLDDVERRNILPLPGLELRPLGRPACSQSLYQLRHMTSVCRGTKSVEFWRTAVSVPKTVHLSVQP
jgi:hypothetical protein